MSEQELMKDLVEKVLNKDEYAAEELVNLTYKTGYYVVRTKGINDEEVIKDILQEAYMKAFASLHTLDDGANFKKWFNRICGNCAITYRKSKLGFTIENESYFSEMDDYDRDISYEERVVNDNKDFDPEANIDYEVLKEGLAKILLELPELQRQAIYAFYYQQLSIQEIAEDYEVNTNTVKSWLNYGRKKIKDALEKLDLQGKGLYAFTPSSVLPWFFENQANQVVVSEEIKIGLQASVPVLLGSLITVTTLAQSGVIAGIASILKGLFGIGGVFSFVKTGIVALAFAGIVGTGAMISDSNNPKLVLLDRSYSYEIGSTIDLNLSDFVDFINSNHIDENKLSISSDINNNKVGMYTVTISYNDGEISKNASISIVDTQGPIFTQSTNKVTFPVNEGSIDQVLSHFGCSDLSGISSITINNPGSIHFDKAGTYVAEIQASDTIGNSSIKNCLVIIKKESIKKEEVSSSNNGINNSNDEVVESIHCQYRVTYQNETTREIFTLHNRIEPNGLVDLVQVYQELAILNANPDGYVYRIINIEPMYYTFD